MARAHLRRMNQRSNDPGLNLEFVDEALASCAMQRRKVYDSAYWLIAYRPSVRTICTCLLRNVSSPMSISAKKKQNRAIREFLTARGYVPDEGVYVASKVAPHLPARAIIEANVDVFADELNFCHKVPFKGRLHLDSPTICNTDLLLEKMQIVEINLKDFKDTRPDAEHRCTSTGSEIDRHRLHRGPDAPDGASLYVHDQPQACRTICRNFRQSNPQKRTTRAYRRAVQKIESAPKTMG